MYTLQDIKDMYYQELAEGTTTRGFEEYMRSSFVRVYDRDGNQIGYSIQFFTQALH